jgi:putative endonuclease
MTTPVSKGVITELFAEQYLTQQGLVPVTKNFRCRLGEIDLIMRDGNTYVFIEVKFRKNSVFGGAISAISANKMNKIKHTATFYLHQAGLNEYNTACRIDVIALEGNINKPSINWLKNAF